MRNVSQPPGRHLILIAGMHRSGTSALTGVLGKLGVELGEELLPPGKDNPKGYFENVQVVAAQEALFASLQHAWHDPRPLPANWERSPAAADACTALTGIVTGLKERARAGTVAVKDPRSSRVLPLWWEVAERARARPGVVLVIRHPDEVAASLHRRDGLSRMRAHLLWMRYLLDAERASRGTPRVFVGYDALLADWRGEIGRIGAALDIDLAADAAAADGVEDFLDGSLRNHAVARADDGESPIAALAGELHALALRCAAASGDAAGATDASDEFDAIAHRLQPLAAPYLEALEDCLSFELSLQMEEELERQGLQKSRIDMSRQLAALRELWRPALVESPARPCKLYYRDSESDFVEARTVVAEPEPAQDGLVAAFDLPADVAVDYLRLDPSDGPGAFAVQSVCVDGVPLADIGERLGRISELPLPVTSTQVPIRFAAIGEDPHFELDVRDCPQLADRRRSVRVEMFFRVETVASEIGRHLGEQQQALAGRFDVLASHLDGQQQALAGRFDALASHLDGQQQALTERLDASVSHLRGQHRDLAGRLDAATRELGGKVGSLSSDLDRQRQRLESMGAEMQADRAGADQRQQQLMALLRETHAGNAALANALEDARRQQGLLLAWARRRSPRYWLGRLVGRRDLVPYANVAREPGGDDAAWVAGNDDPQFLLEGPPLAGGWYLFTADTRPQDGELVSPCLYPDYGSGVSALEQVSLPGTDAHGRIRGVVRLKAPVKRLRFDPSTRPGRFALGAVRLRRIGRVQALLRMALAAAGPQRAWRRSLQVLGAFARKAWRGRVREGGDAAYAGYLQAALPLSDDYEAWVRNYDTLTPADLERMRASVGELQRTPLVSILLPVYQTPPRWLRRCLDSVLAQVYPNWELCIADDASPSPQVRRILDEYAGRDPRIRVRYRERNGHISAASNSALELARGEYIALLDHDDELRPHALLEMAKAINAHPQWRLLYSDEDKIDEKGRRFAPYFKPDWNYELFLSQNCICHLGVYETALVREVGGFREGFEGSQDWDLALRCVERLAPGEIGHVPKVLYHWRAIAGSTAMGGDQKDYAGHAGLRAVDEHLRRSGCPARVEINSHGHLNVYRSLPSPPPRVSLIIPTRDKVELLRMCLQSIFERTDYPDYEVIVVDNQSSEPATLKYFRELEADPRARVLRYDAPFNYSAINNHAAAHATGSIIGLINNDIEVITPDWLTVMASQAARPEIGVVGAMLYYPDDTIQHAGVVLGLGSVAGHVYTGQPAGSEGQCGRALLAQEMSAVTAACLLVRREVFEAVGGLDEKLFVAFNDIDFCLRVRQAGYRNLWTPYAQLYHHESASRGYEDTPEKQARFCREVDLMRSRWGDALLHDPCYNPNLTLSGAAFELAFPPR